jgi:hypothetical protein
MKQGIKRRTFLRMAAVGSAASLGCSRMLAFGASPRTASQASPLISPGCRRSKVKVARLYLGTTHGLWPKPNLDFQAEIRFYEGEFLKLKEELSDVEFPVDALLTSAEQIAPLKDRLKAVDGILAIHFNIGISSILNEILKVGQPTMVFAVPYSGHEWVGFGALRNEPLGAKMDCLLTSDYRELAAALRPFRAIHHLREAKILNLTTSNFAEYAGEIKNKFGTEIKPVGLQRMVETYNAVDDRDAAKEAERWIKGAERIVEPSRENIFKSVKLALAFEKLLDEEDATVMTVDCYGSMWDKTIKLPAYPCLGFTRLNDMGLGGVCESDLRCAMTHILMQGLAGKPGFVSDPTVDESKNTIILAHCLGTTRMDGPRGPAAPYKLRTVMERQEGVVPQVQMRLGEKVTQAILIGKDLLQYFTGEIVAAPVGLEADRGCRTKIEVKIDGSATNLWRNWANGLHRQTCYGDITPDLARFCRFKEIKMINEAA